MSSLEHGKLANKEEMNLEAKLLFPLRTPATILAKANKGKKNSKCNKIKIRI